jgi:hypothetical protein
MQCTLSSWPTANWWFEVFDNLPLLLKPSEGRKANLWLGGPRYRALRLASSKWVAGEPARLFRHVRMY